jgi:hypothetical protein
LLQFGGAFAKKRHDFFRGYHGHNLAPIWPAAAEMVRIARQPAGCQAAGTGVVGERRGYRRRPATPGFTPFRRAWPPVKASHRRTGTSQYIGSNSITRGCVRSSRTRDPGARPGERV